MKIYYTNHLSNIKIYKPINSNIMENLTPCPCPECTNLRRDLRIQAAKQLFDGLTFSQATNTAEWDALTCDEQMTIEDLIG